MRWNNYMKLVCRSMVIGRLTMPAISLIADTPAFVLGDVLTVQPVSFTGTRGWQFAHGGYSGTEDILITQLGIFDEGGDGLVNSHEVGLWRAFNITGTLLASATVPAGTVAPLEWGYRWVDIEPVRIPYSAFSYAVGAHFVAGDADDMLTPRPSGPWPNFEFAPEIGAFPYVARLAFGDALTYPLSQLSCGQGCTPEVFWEANFKYVIVPEPSLWFMGLPLLLLGFRRAASRHKEDGRMRNEE